MCLAKDENSPSKEVSPPRSPWAKLLNRKNSKPRLPRKVASSTRVNLNKCWSKLGELISNHSPRADLPSQKTAYPEEPIIVPYSNFYPLDPVEPAPVEDDDNAPNQNIVITNRYEFVSEDTEISDNITNEERELCYAGNYHNCYVCKLCF